MTRSVEAAARLAPSAERMLEVGLRAVVAGGLSLLPGVGAAVQEAISAHREAQAVRNFDLFAGRVELLEERLGCISGAEEYIASAQGREHVAEIFEQALRANGESHRESLAAAYLSGIGYGRFKPDVVLLLDSTLRHLSEYHVQILRWCFAKQREQSLQQRLRESVRMEYLTAEVAAPPAIVQKVVGDLIDARVLMDCGINKFGGYWGALSFALTSFGMSLATFIESPNAFAQQEPELESPFPPSKSEDKTSSTA